MNPARMVYENAPAFIPVPTDLQHRRVEAIFWPLDATVAALDTPQKQSEPLTPLTQLIGKAKGCFDSATEIDTFLRAERDSWDR